MVYILTCPCNLIYVGETTHKKNRISQHRNSISTKQPGLPVPKQFLEHGHRDSDLKFMVLEEIPRDKRGGDRILKTEGSMVGTST